MVSYTHSDGMTYMLVIHQAILIPDVKVVLIFPMQLRDNDIKVNDEPKSMLEILTADCHALVISDLAITLCLKGVVSYFIVTSLTAEEYERSPMVNRLEDLRVLYLGYTLYKQCWTVQEISGSLDIKEYRISCQQWILSPVMTCLTTIREESWHIMCLNSTPLV